MLLSKTENESLIPNEDTTWSGRPCRFFQCLMQAAICCAANEAEGPKTGVRHHEQFVIAPPGLSVPPSSETLCHSPLSQSTTAWHLNPAAEESVSPRLGTWLALRSLTRSCRLRWSWLGQLPAMHQCQVQTFGYTHSTHGGISPSNV